MKLFASLIASALFLYPCGLAQQGSPEPFNYKSGYTAIMNLGRDVYTFLKPSEKQTISPQPVSFETDATPFVRLLYYPEEPRPIRGVWISAGFIDLVNRISHAKAIDRIERGYFGRYIELLSRETGEKSLKALPNSSNPAYWTDEILNEQLSNFNSIVGTVVGIQLAHHYLGHYDKYRSRLEDANGNPNGVSINSLLTPQEWADACARGVQSALDAGCMIEGIVPFYEAFEKMKARPQWAGYFLPAFASVQKMKKDMARMQKRFLTGGRES
jgi:hypothetical protein